MGYPALRALDQILTGIWHEVVGGTGNIVPLNHGENELRDLQSIIQYKVACRAVPPPYRAI